MVVCSQRLSCSIKADLAEGSRLTFLLPSLNMASTTTLRQIYPDRHAFKNDPELGDRNDLSHFIVLFDDEQMYGDIPLFVPIQSTFTPYFLAHRPPAYYAERMHLHDFMKSMIEDYKTFNSCIRAECGDAINCTVGLVDLCRHAGKGVDAGKQAAFAFLLSRHDGNRPKAWAELLEWWGPEEDHTTNFSTLFEYWVLPALCKDDEAAVLENDLTLSDDDNDTAADGEEENEDKPTSQSGMEI